MQNLFKKINSKKIPRRKEERMLSIIKSMSLIGLEGYLISVQVDISAGIPRMGNSRTSRYEY